MIDLGRFLLIAGFVVWFIFTVAMWITLNPKINILVLLSILIMTAGAAVLINEKFLLEPIAKIGLAILILGFLGFISAGVEVMFIHVLLDTDGKQIIIPTVIMMIGGLIIVYSIFP